MLEVLDLPLLSGRYIRAAKFKVVAYGVNSTRGIRNSLNIKKIRVRSGGVVLVSQPVIFLITQKTSKEHFPANICAIGF